MDIVDDGTCFACGEANEHGLHLKFDLDANDRSAQTNVSIDPIHSGWKNAAHGGIVSTMLDEVMVYACSSINWLVATARLSVRFRKPVPVDTQLKLRAEVTSVRSRMITVKGALLQNNRVLANAEATMAAMRELSETELKTMRAIRSFKPFRP